MFHLPRKIGQPPQQSLKSYQLYWIRRHANCFPCRWGSASWLEETNYRAHSFKPSFQNWARMDPRQVRRLRRGPVRYLRTHRRVLKVQSWASNRLWIDQRSLVFALRCASAWPYSFTHEVWCEDSSLSWQSLGLCLIQQPFRYLDAPIPSQLSYLMSLCSSSSLLYLWLSSCALQPADGMTPSVKRSALIQSMFCRLLRTCAKL